MNANVDLIVSGTALLRHLNATGGSQADHDVLESVQDLQEMFEHRMARCAAAERVYKHEKGYLEIVEHAHSLKEKQVEQTCLLTGVILLLNPFSISLEEMQLSLE